MQAHLTCYLQQQNIQDILNQTKFYLDNRRSHCRITLHRKQNFSYRENAIQAKMQSRRREQRGDDQD